MDTCKLVAGYLDFLAEKYPATKFVSIVGDKVRGGAMQIFR